MSIPIIDTFGVLTDEKMPFLAQALNPSSAEREMQSAEFRLPDELRTRNSELGTPLVKSIRVVRYKPGRRCLIEYKLSAPQLPTNSLTILGKVRAKGLDRKCFELMQTLWQEDFGPQRADGIHVPQPIGVIPAFQMWLQAKVPGLPATELLAGPDGVNLARRIAEGIHKLHQANLPAHRSHRMGDELRILRDRLVLVEQIKPSWSSRLERLLAACERLAGIVPETRLTGIHRDFYPAQVLVHGRELYFLDFDLFCHGNPALDVGNFLGHLTEQGLRTLGSPEALQDRESALAERFLELSGEGLRTGVQAYHTLTLVRHIYLSTQFRERIPFNEALLHLCEERLARVR